MKGCGHHVEAESGCAKPQLQGERPVRVQLSRAKGWRMPPNTVKVDRSTKWGNPFNMAAAIDWGFATKDSAQRLVVDCFRAWLPGGAQADSLWQGPHSDRAREPFRDLSPLRGKNLACWCKLPEPGQPDICHAAVLLELANGPPPASTAICAAGIDGERDEHETLTQGEG